MVRPKSKRRQRRGTPVLGRFVDPHGLVARRPAALHRRPRVVLVSCRVVSGIRSVLSSTGSPRGKCVSVWEFCLEVGCVLSPHTRIHTHTRTHTHSSCVGKLPARYVVSRLLPFFGYLPSRLLSSLRSRHSPPYPTPLPLLPLDLSPLPSLPSLTSPHPSHHLSLSLMLTLLPPQTRQPGPAAATTSPASWTPSPRKNGTSACLASPSRTLRSPP